MKQLTNEIEGARQQVKTDRLDMSIGELASIYEKGELNLHPDFQRIFRWNLRQKCRLIESLLLGIPLPSIFVAQDENGFWDVIDGVQRLSTIFEFMGILRKGQEVTSELHPQLILAATKILPSLNNICWADPEGRYELPLLYKLSIKRSKLHVVIIDRQSSPETKFELFQRLNAGGSVASRQELRNCSFVMANAQRYDDFVRLSGMETFRKVISLTEKDEAEQFAAEQALRFLALIGSTEEAIERLGDIGDFLDDQVLTLCSLPEGEWRQRSEIFERVFGALNQTFGSDAFRKYDLTKDRHIGATLSGAFEFIAIGIGRRLVIGQEMPNQVENAVKNAWSSNILSSESGGKRANTRIRDGLTKAKEYWNAWS